MLAKTIPVARPSFGVGEERAVLEVLRSGWVSQGPRVAEFERSSPSTWALAMRWRFRPARPLCIWRLWPRASNPVTRYCVPACRL